MPVSHDHAWIGSRRRAVLVAVLRAIYRVVESNTILVSLAALVVIGSFALSMSTDAWHWFQRSGALLVSIGAVFSTRRALRAMLNAILCELLARPIVESSATEDLLTQTEIDACVIGFLMVGIGTLTWAYGDLVGCLFRTRCL